MRNSGPAIIVYREDWIPLYLKCKKSTLPCWLISCHGIHKAGTLATNCRIDRSFPKLIEIHFWTCSDDGLSIVAYRRNKYNIKYLWSKVITLLCSIWELTSRMSDNLLLLCMYLLLSILILYYGLIVKITHSSYRFTCILTWIYWKYIFRLINMDITQFMVRGWMLLAYINCHCLSKICRFRG